MTKLLDHGSIKLVESWGSDERIIEAARMSTDKGFKGWGPFPCPGCEGRGVVGGYEQIDYGIWTGSKVIDVPCPDCKGSGEKPGDEKLLRYLWEHKHHTPFEMAGAIFEVQAPIFVAREWMRHRAAGYNELSARYTPIPDLNYIPSVERLLAPGGTNKQAQGTGAELTEKGATAFLAALEGIYDRIQNLYEDVLADGVPKELARLVIPVGRYTKFRVTSNLRMWLHFLTLRNDPAAQWEIQVYAQAVQATLREAFPRTLTLFEES